MRSLLLPLALVLLALCGTASHASVLHGARAPPGAWRRVKGDFRLDEVLPMSVGLQRRNMDRLESILLDVSNPASPNYGNHLNHAQMTELVSPGPKAVATVVAWLRQHGARDIVVARHQDSVKFKATRGQVERLLKVQFELYENTVSKQLVPRALGEVHVPPELAGIVELVAGHRGFPVPLDPRPKATLAAAGGPASMNVTPSLIYSIYNEQNIPPTPPGVRNVQSFFQAEGQYVSQTDLSTFCAEMLPGSFSGSCAISKYIGQDQNSSPGVESSLDSQYIISTGYGLETWAYSYSGTDFCQDLVQWGQDVFGEEDGTFPFVISMSYGSQRLPAYCEGDGQNRINADTMKMGAMGITVVIASGDNGSGEDSRSQWNWGFLGTSFPAELPYVTAVGATTFEAGNGGAERAATFSGGGFSFNWVAPAYQQAAIAVFFQNNTQLPPAGLLGPSYNASGRGTPDVALVGENYYVVDGGQVLSVAGTSCSTPTFAGMVARLNNIRLLNNKTLGFINPLIYANPQAFTDITAGTNDMNNDGMGWYCKVGWDPVTGLGTPNFASLSSVVQGLNDKEHRKS